MKFVFLFLCLVVMISCQASGEIDSEILFPDEEWNKFPAEDVQTFTGTLERASEEQSAILQREYSYRLKESDSKITDIYTGGENDILNKHLDHKVEIKGKLVEFELEGTKVREIWPSEIRNQ
jgi:hypothetical protein